MKNEETHSIQPTTRRPFSRREFLKLSMAAAGALAFPVLVGCQPAPKTPTPTTAPSVTPGVTPSLTPRPSPTPDDNFPQPKTISSVGGLLETTLLIKMQAPPSTFTSTPPVTQLRMYGSPKNGTSADPNDDTQWDWSFPGPTLRVNAGDRIKLKLLNYLPLLTEDEVGVCEPANYPTPGPTPSTTPAAGTPTLTPAPAFNNDVYPNCFNENNVTNMHYHGMHIDQGESGDDVLLAIYPNGQSEHDVEHGTEHGMIPKIGENDYDFVVPTDHPQGTFWYHPHKHGATDIQVANGMAGAIIVNDTLNDEPVFQNQPPVEQTLVIQSILQNLAFPTGGGPGTQTVNGITNPTINMRAGEVQRWRLINATGQAVSAFNLTLAGDEAPEMYLIAVDGNFLDESHWNSTTPTQALFLAPGNRADVLVYAPAEGQFGLQVQAPSDNQKPKDATPTPIPTGTGGFTPLLTVNVSGTMSPPMQLPAKLPPLPFNLRPFGPDEVDAGCRTITFQLLSGAAGGQGAKKGNAPQWAINGKKFDPSQVDQCMLLDTSETWTLVNTTNIAHPFHIHLNPFLIQEFNDPTPNDPNNPLTTGDNPIGQWQDTIIIPNATFNSDGSLKQAGQVVIRHRFPQITGKFVLHCHILGHEDRGMMQLLEVVADKSQCTAENASGSCTAPAGTPTPTQ